MSLVRTTQPSEPSRNKHRTRVTSTAPVQPPEPPRNRRNPRATAVTLTQQTSNPRNNNANAFHVPRHILYRGFTGHLPLDRTSMECGVPS